MLRNKSLYLTFLTLFGAVSFFFAAKVSIAEQLTLPAEIAGLKLRHLSHGEEAIRSINKLHGKELSVMQNGYVAHYESNGVKAMFYISEYTSGNLAREQIDIMVEKIEKGSKEFGHFREFEIEENIIYMVLGFGQVHYFYTKSNNAIWLAIDPPVAETVLKATIKIFEAVQ